MLQLYVIVSKGYGFFPTSVWLQGGSGMDPTNPDFLLNLNCGH